MVDKNDIDAAVQVLRRGGLVAMPTETVYGLAADANNPEAVRLIFAVKGRPASHPLIVHLPDATQLGLWADAVPEEAEKLAAAFWPGPLTLVLRRAAGVDDVVTGGLDTVALRVPSHPVALALLGAFGGGIAAPSANRFGRVSPTTAEHVRNDLGRDVEIVLDGGSCPVGIESTIVDLSTRGRPSVLRPGAITRQDLERVLGRPIGGANDSKTRAPGCLKSHYRPAARVEILEREALAGRVQELTLAGAKVYVIASSKSPAFGDVMAVVAIEDHEGFARRLYATMREADAMGADVIAIERVSRSGIGEAILDRLERASSS